MSERQYDGVLIDFYGTICAGDRDAVDTVCRRVVEHCGLLQSPPELAVAWGERFFDVLAENSHGSFRTLRECVLTSLRDTLGRLGVSLDPAPFVARLEDYWVDPPVYSDALDFSKLIDLPICCVSNADTRPLISAIAKHGLRFDAVISSEAVRCYKPDAAIFEHALEALGIEAHRAIHVGDSLYADVGGAAMLGITTVWVCRRNRIHDIGTHRPDYTIASLEALPGLLAPKRTVHPG